VKTAIGLFDPTQLVHDFGPLAVVIVACIIFAETGLLAGFFLPGDSILFPMGLLMATGVIDFPLWLACIMFSGAAWLGDQTGYWVGRKLGPAVFNKTESKFFSQKNVSRTNSFFERYGSKAVIFAHFVPVLRTFVPVAAGVGEMKYRRFLKYNFVGVLVWASGVTLIGAGLGQVPLFRDHVEIVTAVFFTVSWIPIITEVLKARRERRN
jgi:membrane-associated protein